MFENFKLMVLVTGSLIYGGGFLLLGMHLLKRLWQTPIPTERHNHLPLFFEAFFTTLSFCILLVLWIEPLRDSFTALLLSCVLASTVISAKYFHINLNDGLAIAGMLVFLFGAVLYTYLFWHYIAALNLDRFPGEYSKLAACNRTVEKIYVTDRVISANDFTTITVHPSQDYLEQGCEAQTTLTLNTPDFETSSPRQELTVTSGNSWRGGAWIIQPKKTGIFQLSISNGSLNYAMGVSVIPGIFGLKYDWHQKINTLLLLTGVVIVLLSVKQKTRHELDKRQ